MASAMDVDDEEAEVPTCSGKGEKKRFEVKKVKTKLFLAIDIT